MVDWPSPPYVEPHGPAGDDEEVVRAYVRDELPPYSGTFHVEGPVLMADRDQAVALRLGPRSFLVNRDVFPNVAPAKALTEEIFRGEGLQLLDEDTLYGASVGVQQVGLRYTSWDLWGADLEQAFADLRVEAAGGQEDILFGGGNLPFSY